MLESLLSYIILAMIPFVSTLISETISQLKKWKCTIAIISTFTSFGLTTMTAIQDVTAGNLSFNDFYIIMGIFAGIIIILGYRYRNGVKASFKKTYLAFVTGYTYIFVAAAVSMYWMSPYFKIPV